MAQQLHIRVRYLDALECGRLNELPGISYTKGYLQVYANYIGLDKDEILRRFEDVEQAMGKRGFYFPQVLNKEKSPNSNIVWGSVGGGGGCLSPVAGGVAAARQPVSLVEQFPHKKPKSGRLWPMMPLALTPRHIIPALYYGAEAAV